jgi:hypothetical protein
LAGIPVVTAGGGQAASEVKHLVSIENNGNPIRFDLSPYLW